MKDFELKELDFEKIDNLTLVKIRDPKFEARAVRTTMNEEIPIHFHEDIEITCQISGSSTNYINGVEYQIHEGEFIIINNQVPHYNDPITNNKDQVFVIIISKNFLNNLVIESGFDPTIIHLKNILMYNQFNQVFTMPPILKALVNEIIHNIGDDEYPIIPFKQRLLIGLFILELANVEFNEQLMGDGSKLDVISYIQDNLQTASMSDFAAIINYSSSYVSRRIKQDFGMSFIDIVIELRMLTAAKLLISTNKSIETIMIEIGYNNKSHFYELFKKRFLITPHYYRKQNKK